MDSVLGFLMIAGLIVGLYLWQKAKSAASKQISQKVLFRGSHERGQKAVHTGMRFTTPTASAWTVLDAVRAHAALTTVTPSLKGASYISSVNANQFVISIGNKLVTHAQLILTANDHSGGTGCTGTFKVANWTESDGIVAAFEEVERLFGLVRTGVTNADPAATFSDFAVT